MRALVWADGRVLPADRPVLRADDHGVVVGDGVFETVKVVDGRPFALSRHLARLERSAAGLDLPVDRNAVRTAISDLLAAADPPPVRARLRITLTGGPAPLASDRGDAPPTLLAGLGSAAPPPAAVDVVLAPWPRNERGATAGLKTTSYAENVVALGYAHDRGAGEALFANTRGELCEGTGSNVFVAVDGRLLTPPLDSGCLAGITRALLLEWLPDAAEAALSPAQLSAAEEAFLCSSLRDVQPIATVDGAALPAVPGPLTRRAAAVFAERSAEAAEP